MYIKANIKKLKLTLTRYVNESNIKVNFSKKMKNGLLNNFVLYVVLCSIYDT